MLGVPGEAAVEPAVGALGRARGVLAGDVERRALVEHERDVGAERGLDLHRGLRRHEALGAVEVGAEAHALLGDLEDRAGALAVRLAALDLVGDGAVAHREDLEAARVGDHRPVPAHEAVQAADPPDQLVAGREEEVERVAEHHVVAELGGLLDLERLDHGLRRERDEGGRADLAVGEPQRAGARARRGVAVVDLEAGHGRRSLRRAPAPAASGGGRRLAALDGLLATVARSRSGAACAARASGCGSRARRGRSSRRRRRRRCPWAASASGRTRRTSAPRGGSPPRAARARPCAHRRRSACRPRARSGCPPRTCPAGRRGGRSGRRTRRGPWPAPSGAARARRIRRESNAVLKRRFISLCSELSSRSGSQRTMVIEVPPFSERVDLTAGPILRSQSGRIKFSGGVRARTIAASSRISSSEKWRRKPARTTAM